MRIGASSSGRWWISMGPIGWLLFVWFALPVMAIWYAGQLLVRLCVLACRAIAESRRQKLSEERS